MKVFMIGGKINSGKDTIARFFNKWYNFKRFAFADCLKYYVADKYSFNVGLCFSQEGKETLIVLKGGALRSVRELLIKEASLKRELDPYFWCKKLLGVISEDNEKYDAIVISDFRYPNEYEFMKSHFTDVTTIKIQRLGLKNLDDPSEKALDNFNFDYTLTNNKTLENFENEFLELSKKF